MQLAQLTEKYEMMTRAAERGALDGANNVPEPHATRLSATELSIRNLAQSELDELGDEQKRKVEKELAAIAEEAARLPFAIQRSQGEFRVVAEGIVQDAGYELISLYKTKLEREKDYRLFKAVNGLQREAAPAQSLFEALAYFILMLAVDGCMNAYFFKNVGTLGLADGFAIAGIIAGCNIALGFLAGWGPLRFFGHRHRLHLLWAIPVFLLLIIVALSFNWGVAHYRDLVQTNKTGGLPDVLAMLRDNPYGVLSFPSYLMALIGLGVAIYSAARAYTMFDTYPWYGWTFKRMKSAEDDFLDEASKTKAKIQAEGEKFMREAAEEYQAVTTSAHKLLAAYDRVIGRFNQYEADAQTVQEACNATLDIYRENNVRVRDDDRFPAPLYFEDRVILRRRADLHSQKEIAAERELLHQRTEKLRVAQEELGRSVPATKLDLLSEASMNSRLEKVTRMALDQHADDRVFEAHERAAFAAQPA